MEVRETAAGDPELPRIVAAWADLPEHVKSTITTIIESTTGQAHPVASSAPGSD
jgi:hypothetical protein